MACPTKAVLESMAPLSVAQVTGIIADCGFTGTDKQKYEQWVASFNWLPPPPPANNFQPNFAAWVAANFNPT